MTINKSQPVCPYPQGSRPARQASRPAESRSHNSRSLGDQPPLQQLSNTTEYKNVLARLTSNKPIHSYMQAETKEMVIWFIFSTKQHFIRNSNRLKAVLANLFLIVEITARQQ